MQIRRATDQDSGEIRQLYYTAFPQGESGIVAQVALELLCGNTTPETISLLAITDNTVVGHVAFSPVGIDHLGDCSAYILAPLAVHPDYQKRGFGSALINYGMQLLSDLGVNIVFVYGDPAYYSRFGFAAEFASDYVPPYPLQYPFGWQAIALKDFAVARTPESISCVAALCDPKLW
ncbi:MAG: N-acetyltransferase [Porticoccaceae bacterium]